MIDGYCTAKDIAKQWGITPRTVQILCAKGKIAGAVKFGRAWAIPVDTERPTDNRIVTGKYCDYRKNRKKV